MTTDKEHHPDDELDLGPSKTQVKKEMQELQDMGVRLTKLKPAQLAQLNLDDKLAAAIDETKRIKKHEALRRHYQYLGRLMRAVDSEPIRAFLTQLDEGNKRSSIRAQQLEALRDQLLDNQAEAFNQLIEQHPDINRQLIRQLIRNAQKEAATGKPPASARKLFRYLREATEPNATGDDA